MLLVLTIPFLILGLWAALFHMFNTVPLKTTWRELTVKQVIALEIPVMLFIVLVAVVFNV